MCGICGVVDLGGGSVDTGLVRRMTATLAHRGPDDEGFHAEPGVALGMRRLSVIDLATGRQPMTNEDGSVWVVFNGEIYNHLELRQELEGRGHRFATRSDTEVIVHLYEEFGAACVTRLNGMFAFAVWDRAKRELLLARDPLGIKPLYYTALGRRISFASELKALLADPSVVRRIDPQAVADYFRWLYVPGPHTIFQGIQKLPPGSWLRLSARGVEEERYWRVRFPDEPKGVADDARAEQLLETLRRAVRRQLVADVPVGVFLSGGVDSSAIVALAREQVTGRLQTFSAGFPGMGLYDERPHARRVAEHFGCEHHALEMTPSAVDAANAVVAACDEPFGDSSAVPLYYLAAFAKQRVTVALSGTGGDDLFAGYRRYRMARWLPAYQRLPGVVRGWVADAAERLPAHRRNRVAEWTLLARRFCAAAANGASTMEAYAHTLTFFDAKARKALLESGAAPHLLDAWQAQAHEDPINACLQADLTTYLPDDLLVKEDRMTMAVGLEARVPFLDRDVVELALRMPSRLKLRGASTKHVLREAVTPLLPPGIAGRPKHGFAVPVGEWFRGELRPMFLDTVLAPDAASRPWISPVEARALFERQQRGREDLGQHLWALLIFELWCRRYVP